MEDNTLAEGVQTFSESGALSWRDGVEADGAEHLVCVGDQTLGVSFQKALEVLLTLLLQDLQGRKTHTNTDTQNVKK